MLWLKNLAHQQCQVIQETMNKFIMNMVSQYSYMAAINKCRIHVIYLTVLPTDGTHNSVSAEYDTVDTKSAERNDYSTPYDHIPTVGVNPSYNCVTNDVAVHNDQCMSSS